MKDETLLRLDATLRGIETIFKCLKEEPDGERLKSLVEKINIPFEVIHSEINKALMS